MNDNLSLRHCYGTPNQLEDVNRALWSRQRAAMLCCSQPVPRGRLQGRSRGAFDASVIFIEFIDQDGSNKLLLPT